MHSGTIIVYRERGRLALGVVQKIATTPSKTPVEIIDEDGKKSALAPDRVLFDSKITLPVTLPPADLKKPGPCPGRVSRLDQSTVGRS